MNAEWFAPRPMTSKGYRCRGLKFWGQNKTAPGRGGADRAPACQKRLGESGPAGETGPGLRGFGPLRFWSRKMGTAPRIQNANHACIRGKNANRAREPICFRLSRATLCRSSCIGCMAGLRKCLKKRPRERVLQRLVFGVPLHADDE